MPAERIIAVDFGTSTSVIRVKRYLNGQPVGDRLATTPVTFNMGATMVPTLVQKMKSTGESVYFGHEAEISHKNTETFRNFKVDIENPDPALREQARALTAEFFGFLAKTYRTQSDGGHLGENDDRVRTIISYPVKWSDDTKAFMLETARNAGFPNVEGLDEAQAAIQAVTVQSEKQLYDKGYFTSGTPVNILLIDMGAGTTDLVLCRHTPGENAKTEILTTWPREGGTLFGGHEVDVLLKDYICAAVPEDSADIVRKKIGTDKFKAWKETVVSPALVRGESVDYFSALDDLLGLLDINVEYLVDRPSLESFMSDYLRQLPELVNGCLNAAAMPGNKVDLVILTGGHSQWYFVRDILMGRLNQLRDVGLKQIQDDPERIISISLPQETVALGLVYSPRQIEFPAPLLKPSPQKLITPTLKKHLESAPISEFEQLQDRFLASKRQFSFDGDFINSDGTITSNKIFFQKITNARDFCGRFETMVADSFFSHYLIRQQDNTFILASELQSTGSSNIKRQMWLDKILHPYDKSTWASCLSFEVISAEKWLLAGITNDGHVITNDNRNGLSLIKKWSDINYLKSGLNFLYGVTNSGMVKVAPFQLNNASIAADLQKEINIYLESNHLEIKEICPCEETGFMGRSKVAVLLNNGRIRCFGEWSRKLQHKNSLESLKDVVQLLRDYTSYISSFVAEESFDGVLRNGKLFEINKHGILSEKMLLSGKRCVGIIPRYGINVRKYMQDNKKMTSNISSNSQLLIKKGQQRLEEQRAFENNTIYEF